MVEERANLDYGRDDRPTEEAASLPNDDYLTIERIEEHEHPSNDVELTDEELTDETDSPSSYGAP
jgi:hypothetical protein